MIYRILAASIFLSATLTGSSQQWKLKRLEAIYGIGTTNVFGDLGGAPNANSLLFIRDINFRSTRPSLYLGLRYRVDPHSTIKTSLIYGFSKTQDYSGSRNEFRGFSSMTDLLEFSANYEFYFLQENRKPRSAALFNRRGMINNYSTLGAYIFGGLGVTMFWPHPDIPAPRPGDKYKSNFGVTPAIPIGIGIKYIISDRWILGYEIGYRQTFSDFLDGFVSPFSKRPDVYWISTLNLSFRIPTSRKGLPLFMDKDWRRTHI